MNEAYLRPGKILATFSRLYPDAWKVVDEFRANRKGLGNWPDWCFLPLAGTYAIVSKGTSIPSLDRSQNIGVLGALAAWRVTQGVYRFDPSILDALWETPVTGDIPTEVLFHLPEWCVYVSTPGKTWHGAALHGVFAHLEHDVNDKRTELRFVLDVTGPGGDDLVVMPVHLGKGGVGEGIAAMVQETARHTPVSVQMPDGLVEELTDDVSPLVSLVLYLCSQAAEVRVGGGGVQRPFPPQPVKTKKGLRLFPPERPTPWEVGYRLDDALRTAQVGHEARTGALLRIEIAVCVIATDGEQQEGEEDHPVVGVRGEKPVGPAGAVGESVDPPVEAAVHQCAPVSVMWVAVAGARRSRILRSAGHASMRASGGIRRAA